MANIYPINPRYKITPFDNGKYGVLGTASKSDAGFWRVEFVPDQSWSGSFAIMGRSNNPEVEADGVGFSQIPYRRVTLAGAPSDRALTTAIISDSAIVMVPAEGLQIALLVECLGGFGYLYSMPLVGALTP